MKIKLKPNSLLQNLSNKVNSYCSRSEHTQEARTLLRFGHNRTRFKHAENMPPIVLIFSLIGDAGNTLGQEHDKDTKVPPSVFCYSKKTRALVSTYKSNH